MWLTKKYAKYCVNFLIVCMYPMNFALLDAAELGLYESPFASNSLWKSKPVAPVFDDFVIPTSKFAAALHDGQYSTRCFLAKAKDTSMKVKGTLNQKGIYDADGETFSDEITIPHWPADLIPATGGDGHADIFDIENGIIYSFWQLKKVDGIWRATSFGWMPLNGSGWANPGHYHQGSRAVGIASCAGIIRKHELYDDQDMYHHALAMSLPNNALSKNPAYVFPATISDGNISMNVGKIPEGSLVMLPKDFDISTIKSPELRKVAKTLQIYGAYVVDMNYETPYVFYVEIGSQLNFYKAGNINVYQELDLLRQKLRLVKSVQSWVDEKGSTFKPNQNLNLLSMRGPWQPINGNAIGRFDSLKQSVIFDKANIVQTNFSGRSIPSSLWANPVKGEPYKLKGISSGGAKIRLKLLDKNTKKVVYESKDLTNGESERFQWPCDSCTSILTVSGGNAGSSSISGELIHD